MQSSFFIFVSIFLSLLFLRVRVLVQGEAQETRGHLHSPQVERLLPAAERLGLRFHVDRRTAHPLPRLRPSVHVINIDSLPRQSR